MQQQQYTRVQTTQWPDLRIWRIVRVGEAFKMGTRPQPGRGCMRTVFDRGCFGLRGPIAHCELLFVLQRRCGGTQAPEVWYSCGITWSRPVWLEQRPPKRFEDLTWHVAWFHDPGELAMNAMWKRARALVGRPFNWTGFLLNFLCCCCYAYNARGRAFFCSELTAAIKAVAYPSVYPSPHRYSPSHSYRLVVQNHAAAGRSTVHAV